ncbi:MAG: hypothetical protein IT428_10425 [Planctomycetaceae bacterium]|nr:hypothetical protein [Planctomycetaceae bacterium]
MASKLRSHSGRIQESGAAENVPSLLRVLVLASAPWVLGALLVTGVVSWAFVRIRATAPSLVVTGASRVGQCVALARMSAAAATAATAPVVESPVLAERRSAWQRLATGVSAMKAKLAEQPDAWFPKRECVALVDRADLVLQRMQPLLGGGQNRQKLNEAVASIPGLTAAADMRLQSLSAGMTQAADARTLVRLLQFELFGGGTSRPGTADDRRKELARLSASLASLKTTIAENDPAWFPQAAMNDLLTKCIDIATEAAKLEDDDDPAPLRGRMDAARQTAESLSRQAADAVSLRPLVGRCQELAEAAAGSSTALTAEVPPLAELIERRRGLAQLGDAIDAQLRDVSAHSASWFPRAEAEALLSEAAALLKQASRDAGSAAVLKADSEPVRTLMLRADALESESQRMMTVATELTARPFGLSGPDWMLALLGTALLAGLAFRLAAAPDKDVSPFDEALRESRDVCEVDAPAGIHLCQERSLELLKVAEEYVGTELRDSVRGFGSAAKRSAPHRDEDVGVDEQTQA